MLTTFDQDEYVYEAMKAGASGFLLKDVRREELVNAVRVGRRRRRAAGPAAHAAPDRGLRAPPAARRRARGRARRADRPRARGAAPGGPRPLQRRDRRATWSSARRPSRPTSRGYSPSSACATGSRWSCMAYEIGLRPAGRTARRRRITEGGPHARDATGERVPAPRVLALKVADTVVRSTWSWCSCSSGSALLWEAFH